MQPINFQISRRETGWCWRTEGDDGAEVGAGSAATRAEAAAMVIRSIVRAEFADADEALRRRLAA